MTIEIEVVCNLLFKGNTQFMHKNSSFANP